MFIAESETRCLSTKAQIKRVAHRLFALKGYHETSMQDIADEVSVNKATLFFHYQSKCNLFLSVLEELASVFQETTRNVLEESRDASLERTLYNVLRAFMMGCGPECLLLWRKTLLMISSDIEDDVREGSRAIMNKASTAIYRALIDAVSARALKVPEEQVESLVTYFSLFTQCLMDWRVLHMDFTEAAFNERIERMWHHFWYGCRPNQ